MIDADVLPLPKTRRGWLISVFVIAICFAVYYPFLFPWLESAYRKHFWTSVPTEVKIGSTKLDVTIRTPKYISSFAAAELVITIKNCNDSLDQTANEFEMVLELEDKEENQIAYLLEGDDEILTITGENRLSFGVIPPGVTITKHIWLRLTNYKLSDSNTPNDIENTDIHTDIYLMSKSPSGAISWDNIEINRDTDSVIDSLVSLIQALIGAILLPPLSNGLIVLLSLFAVYSIEDYKYIPDRNQDKPNIRKGSSIAMFFRKLRKKIICIRRKIFADERLGLLIIALTRSAILIITLVIMLTTFACIVGNNWENNSLHNPLIKGFSITSLQALNTFIWLVTLVVTFFICAFIYKHPIRKDRIIIKRLSEGHDKKISEGFINNLSLEMRNKAQKGD